MRLELRNYREKSEQDKGGVTTSNSTNDCVQMLQVVQQAREQECVDNYVSTTCSMPSFVAVWLIPASMSNHMPCKMCDKICYPFPNF